MDDNVNISRIFGIRRLQPTKPQCGSGDNCSDICGVAVGHGSVCTTPPVKGRKRCAVHKGMRVNGYISKLNTEGKGPSIAANMESSIIPNRLSADLQDPRLTHGRETPHNEIFAPVCGFILDDGSPCKMKPLQRNKRCLEHKGKRIHVCQPKFVTEE
ncbi:UNVERIFIED_CONTAM: hypothetical protein Sangu_1419300 [Sesamum angustifolium]|uniref:Uncharacterized protein n=1 Tax=Sesamum angustifolium TaxID=2727405 RepID=A0AAW2N4T3_9LAMI